MTYYISPATTLRELVNMVPNVSNLKLPTAKKLRTNGTPVLFDKDTSDRRLIVYANGFFAYSYNRRCTVQAIHKCLEDIRYDYVDGQYSICDASIFIDQPFLIRLILEGDIRLEMNQNVRHNSHIYSYDNLSQESCNLKDPLDLEDCIVAKLDNDNLHTCIDRLTKKQQLVIEYCYLRRMTQFETARELGISRDAVKVRLDGAMKALKKMLQKYMP